MRRFSHRFLVQAPLARVTTFHRNTKALKLLTPPPIVVTFHRIEPLSEGSVSEFTLWIGPLPVRWRALHTDVHGERGFTDTQATGPFAYWRHHHTFVAIDAKTTEISDAVEARPGRGFWGLVSRLMWLSLPWLFAYRAWSTRRAVEV